MSTLRRRPRSRPSSTNPASFCPANYDPANYDPASYGPENYSTATAKRSLRERSEIEPSVRRRGGLTLLEVILALIILGGALVAIGELIRTASRSARDARDATGAQVIADSLMSEIASGVVPAQPMERQPDPLDPDFVVSVMVERPTQAGLIQVMVLVERVDAIAVGRKSEGFRLVRWMLDPGVELAAPAAEAGATEAGATGGSATGSGG